MKWLIVNTEAFQKGVVPPQVKEYIKDRNPFIILDESTYIKSSSAKYDSKKSARARAILSLQDTGHRAILTGTFMSTSPVDSYDQIEFLKKGFWGEDMYSFQRTYCVLMKIPRTNIKTIISPEIYKRVYNGLTKAKKTSERMYTSAREAYATTFGISESKLDHILAHKEYTPYVNVKDIYERIKNFTIVVRKEDVLDLPAKLYTKVPVPMTSEMRELYKEALNAGIVNGVVVDGLSMYHRLQDICNGYRPVVVGTEPGKGGRIKQIVELEAMEENAKIDTVLSLIDSFDIRKEKAVIFSNRTRILVDTAEALALKGYRVALYNGKVSDKDKEKVKQMFLGNEIDIVCANEASASFGLDWLKAANKAFFISNDNSAERRKQAEDRLHRGGCGKETKQYFDIVVSGSVDERVVEGLKKGTELIKEGKTDPKVFELDEDKDIMGVVF